VARLGLGELREGGAADLAVFDYDPPTPFDDTTVLGHWCSVLSQASVDATIVGGKVLMADGRIELDLDERRSRRGRASGRRHCGSGFEHGAPGTG